MATNKNKPKRLTDRFISTVKEPDVYGDGHRGNGLQLRVTELADGELSKLFQQRVRVNGRQINVPIGPYPIVSLKEARNIAVANAKLARKGIDPRPDKQDEKNKQMAPLFADAAEMVITERRKHWKDGSSTEESWRGELRRYAFPKFGHKRMDEITEDDLIKMSEPLWDSGKRETADHLLRYTNIIFKWCIRKYRGIEIVNPVTDFVREHAPETKYRVNHHRYVPYYQVGEALRKIQGYGGGLTTKLVQECQIYSGVRHGSARNARWDEIDWDNKIWTIPGEHMKMGREHRVPLSTGAMAVLEKARSLKRDDSDLIFPSRNGGGVIGKDTLSDMCRRLNLDGVPHGFRASFATWCAEMGVPQELAEAALAHMPDTIVQAYTHSDYLERRKALMQAWSDHLDGKLADGWKWREGDEELMNALRESQRLLAEAQKELAELRAAVEQMNKAA